jgi:hypothetical protein
VPFGFLGEPDVIIPLLVRGFAVWRLTELVVEDEVTRPVREWVTRRWPGSKLAYLTGCKACSSVWVAAVVVVLPEWMCAVLALSGATMLVNEARDHASRRALQRRMTDGVVQRSREDS